VYQTAMIGVCVTHMPTKMVWAVADVGMPPFWCDRDTTSHQRGGGGGID
jgi:hypothetical protein